jgi:NAD(P)-dependent dehydrogenase (short-subunit alcohol dehydrogenase family)
MPGTGFPFRLDGKVAIVTGGGTGIGATTTELLASLGAAVVITSRKLDVLEPAAADIAAKSGGTVVAIRGDVRDPDSCRDLVSLTAERFGRVDVLVNNAGGSYLFPFVDTPIERFDNTMALNLRGPYVLIQAVVPHMRKQGGGAIVNLSSVAGVNGISGGVPYSAAKAGLQMLTRVVAAELGSENIRCNAIAVGETASEGAVRAWARFGQTPESIGRRFPLGRVGTTHDIAWGVIYLATDMSSWVTGETLAIAGGPILPNGLSAE